MATPETVEIAPLLAPIRPTSPRASRAVRSGLRRAAGKTAVRGGGSGRNSRTGEVAPPDWRDCPSACRPAVLARRSKDLQVAAWLTEALTRTYGFPGLRDGLRVLRGLHEAFWETLHPQIEDGDLEFRAGAG